MMRLPLRAALLAAELCWLYPWSLLLGAMLTASGEAPLLSAATILALLALGQAATLTARRLDRGIGLTRIALVGLGVVASVTLVGLERFGTPASPGWVIAVARGDLDLWTRLAAGLALGFAVYLWTRGIARGRGRIEPDDAEGAFGRGLAALVIFLVLSSFDVRVRTGLQAAAAPWVVGFFVAGLTGLALARLEDVRRRSRVVGSADAIGRQWLPVTLATVVGLIALTILMAWVLSFDLIGAVAGPLLQVVVYAVALAMLVVVIPLILVLELVFRLIRALLPDATLPPPRPDAQFSLFEQIQRMVEQRQVPPEMLEAARWTTIAAVVLLGLLLVARTIAWRYARERRDDDEEERDSVVDWAALRAAFAAWLAGLRARLFGRPTPVFVASPILAPPPPEAHGARDIRAVYRLLLRLGTSVGHRRAPQTTPAEHLPALQDGLDPDDDLAAITAAYERARYGATAPPDPEVDDVRARWERVAGGPPARPSQ